MKEEIKVPEVGESITEGILVEWFVEDGAVVAEEDPLFDLETDKVTMSIASQHAGVLHHLVPAGETVQVGQVVGSIDTNASASPKLPESQEKQDSPVTPETPAPTPKDTEEPPISAEAGIEQAKAKIEGAPGTAGPLSPAVRRMLEEHALDPSTIPAGGKDGRLTKEDILHHLAQKDAETAKPAPTASPVAKTKAASPPPPPPMRKPSEDSPGRPARR